MVTICLSIAGVATALSLLLSWRADRKQRIARAKRPPPFISHLEREHLARWAAEGPALWVGICPSHTTADHWYAHPTDPDEAAQLALEAATTGGFRQIVLDDDAVIALRRRGEFGRLLVEAHYSEVALCWISEDPLRPHPWIRPLLGTEDTKRSSGLPAPCARSLPRSADTASQRGHTR